MRIAIASDHAGYAYKDEIKRMLGAAGHQCTDFGAHAFDPADDYPVYIRPAAEAVGRGACERGIVLGGSGNGEAIVANKVRGVRCALAWDIESARLSRLHNDANVLALGQRLVPLPVALEIVRAWLDTGFEAGRHARRVAMIEPG